MSIRIALGLIGDSLNLMGGILLAWDAVFREHDSVRVKKIAKALQENGMVGLRVSMEGIHITSEGDVELAFIRRNARKAAVGCSLLAVGFVFLLIVRLLEA